MEPRASGRGLSGARPHRASRRSVNPKYFVKRFAALHRRLHWLNFPGAILLTLLQRTPALRVAASVEEMVLASPAGAVLRSAVAAVASLGALHSLAGATTQLTANVNQPAKGTVGKAFSESVIITGLGVSFAQSWAVGNTLPPGIAAQGAVLKGGKWVIDPSSGTLTLSGTPTAAGTYSVSVSGYQYTGLTGPVTTATAQIVIAAAANAAPVIIGQPSNVTTIEGGTVAFSVTYNGTPAPTIQWLKNGTAIAGATSSTLTLSNVTVADAGNYSARLTNSLGSATSNTATLTVNSSQVAPMFTIQPASESVTVGDNVTLTVEVTGTPTPALQWFKDGASLDGQTAASLPLASVQLTDTGVYTVTASNAAGTVTSAAGTLTVSPAPGVPVFTAPPQSQAVAPGTTVVLSAPAIGSPAPTLQWQWNGATLAGATSATLTLANLQPANAGIYTALSTNSFGTTTSDPAIVGVSTTSKVIGAGSEIAHGIYVASNGNTFDQVLPSGAAVAVTAEPGKITRTSFIDLSDDIVQVEFSGAGTLSLVLDTPTGPALPKNYNQSVLYMKGHAGIVITGADHTTNVSVFTVGRITAVNQTLFKDGIAYDGVAGIAFIAIASTDGQFSGVRTADASYFATKGLTGIYAPGVTFNGPVYLGDINASNTATPVLLIGGTTNNTGITGGDLKQANGQPVKVSGLTQLKFMAGSDSNGNLQPATDNQATLLQGGTDVTAQVVVNPSP